MHAVHTGSSVVRWIECDPVFRQTPSTPAILRSVHFCNALTPNHEFTPQVLAMHILMDLHNMRLSEALDTIGLREVTVTPVEAGEPTDALAALALPAFGVEFNVMPDTYHDMSIYGHGLYTVRVGSDIIGYIYRLEVDVFPHLFVVEDRTVVEPLDLPSTEDDTFAIAAEEYFERKTADGQKGYTSVAFANMASIDQYLTYLTGRRGGRIEVVVDDAGRHGLSVCVDGAYYACSPGHHWLMEYTPAAPTPEGAKKPFVVENAPTL